MPELLALYQCSYHQIILTFQKERHQALVSTCLSYNHHYMTDSALIRWFPESHHPHNA